MLLHINELQKHYGGVHALAGVSLTVNTGEVVGLVGDNGAGKSTLMKCITGSESPDSGTITFNDAPLSFGDPHGSRRAGIEMIYQDLNLCPQHDATANIFLGREMKGSFFGVPLPFLDLAEMEKRAQALLGGLNSEINIRKCVGALSGGQQQAVAIARALLFKPKLLIMDEPTAALGVKESARVLDLIRTLKKQGISIILISHRLGDIFEVADRVVLMRHGAVVEDKAISETSIGELTSRILE